MNRHGQQGAVLVVSLVLLLIITAIAASTLTSGTFQTVISTNAQTRQSAFRTAESGAEQTLTQMAVPTSGIADQARQDQQNNTVYTVSGISSLQTGINTPTVTVAYPGDISGMRKAIIPGVDPGSTSEAGYYIVNYQVASSATSSDSRIGTQVVYGIVKIERR